VAARVALKLTLCSSFAGPFSLKLATEKVTKIKSIAVSYLNYTTRQKIELSPLYQKKGLLTSYLK
jgi:hypothetical protein